MGQEGALFLYRACGQPPNTRASIALKYLCRRYRWGEDEMGFFSCCGDLVRRSLSARERQTDGKGRADFLARPLPRRSPSPSPRVTSCHRRPAIVRPIAGESSLLVRFVSVRRLVARRGADRITTTAAGRGHRLATTAISSSSRGARENALGA